MFMFDTSTTFTNLQIFKKKAILVGYGKFASIKVKIFNDIVEFQTQILLKAKNIQKYVY